MFSKKDLSDIKLQITSLRLHIYSFSLRPCVLFLFYLCGHQSCTTGHIQYNGTFTISTEMGRDAVCCQSWCTVIQDSHILLKNMNSYPLIMYETHT